MFESLPGVQAKHEQLATPLHLQDEPARKGWEALVRRLRFGAAVPNFKRAVTISDSIDIDKRNFRFMRGWGCWFALSAAKGVAFLLFALSAAAPSPTCLTSSECGPNSLCIRSLCKIVIKQVNASYHGSLPSSCFVSWPNVQNCAK